MLCFDDTTATTTPPPDTTEIPNGNDEFSREINWKAFALILAAIFFVLFVCIMAAVCLRYGICCVNISANCAFFQFLARNQNNTNQTNSNQTNPNLSIEMDLINL